MFVILGCSKRIFKVTTPISSATLSNSKQNIRVLVFQFDIYNAYLLIEF